MSSNRVIVDPNGRQFFADSFDRFGDDLCELVLSYLTFKDKLIFECLSKQWKRFVFNKQYIIRNRNLFFRKGKDIVDVVNWLSLEALLQKCQFIREICLFNVTIDCK